MRAINPSKKNICDARAQAKRRVPRGYVEVSAEEFLLSPEEYSQEGYWVESKVVS